MSLNLHSLLRPATVRAKALLGWLIFRSRLYRPLLGDKGVIVVFHRVNDAYPNDPITCTEAEFDRFLGFFARFFNVIPLGEMIDRIEQGKGVGNCLSITFDDGYKGNATVAAPILERHGLRACFFVATRFIGTDYVPWWDRIQAIQTQWMTWDDIRGLRRAGHEIGSHTATHPNLGLVVGAEARREIELGATELAAQLGESTGLFAYPYGGKRDWAAANQSIPKELGLRCNVSAFGGTVVAGDDTFALKRTPITRWFRWPYQFGFELVTGSVENVAGEF